MNIFLRLSFRRLCVLLILLLLVLAGSAAAENKTFSSVSEALRYIKNNQPAELTIENVKFKPTDLLKIRDAMPEGSVFHFTSTWGKVQFSDESTEIDLTVRSTGVPDAEFQGFIDLCPNLKLIDNSNHTGPSYKFMIPLIEKYPDITFEWKVWLGKNHYCSTKATAFSTFNEPFDPDALTSKQLYERIRYCSRLKALDLGHNELKDLEFLQFLPDLEFLIVGDNQIHDLTPISQCKHLKYAELFSNYFTDLTPLAACTELLDLNICYCPVHDFSPIDGLENLERFWATMIRGLPKEEQQRFMEVHPNTEVDFKGSHATTNGWRKHPRYKHYIWCLRNSTWIPFDQPLPGEAE